MKTVLLDELSGTVMHHAVNAYLRQVSWSPAVDEAVDDVTGQFAQVAHGDAHTFTVTKDGEEVLRSVMGHVRDQLPPELHDGDDPMLDLAANMGARLVRTVMRELENSLDEAVEG